jgi:hypothetical protein
VRPAQPLPPNSSADDFVPKPFHRTPTGLSTKQRKHADDLAVDLEGGLDISLNVEVNPKDPAGITVPYRILVPRLFHDEEDEKRHNAVLASEQPTGFKRFLSLRGKKPDPEVVEQVTTEQQSPSLTHTQSLHKRTPPNGSYGYDTVSSVDRYDSQGDIRMGGR